MLLGGPFLAGEGVNSPQGALLCRGLRSSHAPAPKPAPALFLPAGEVSDETCHFSAMWKMSPQPPSDGMWRGEAGLVGAGLLLASPALPVPCTRGDPSVSPGCLNFGMIYLGWGTMFDPGASPSSSFSVAKSHTKIHLKILDLVFCSIQGSAWGCQSSSRLLGSRWVQPIHAQAMQTYLLHQGVQNGVPAVAPAMEPASNGLQGWQ